MKSVCRSVRKDGSKQAFSLLYLMTVHIRTDLNVGDFFVLGTEITSSHNQVSKKADIIVL